jgi:hypothetical protein
MRTNRVQSVNRKSEAQPSMSPTTNTEEVAEACLELALNIKMIDKPITSHEARDLAREFAQIATGFESDKLDIDRPLLARAIRYLAHVHAMPPMGDNTEWFTNMLTAVIEVARPNTAVDGEAKLFLRDMLHGINSLLEE